LGKVGEKSEAYAPEVSPDGRRVALVLGDPANDIYVYEIERGVRTKLTNGAVVTPSPLWSPDGTAILFTSQAQAGTYSIGIVPADGSTKWREIYKTTDRLEPTSWSRDGKYVLLNHGNIGATDIWVLPVSEPGKAAPFVATPAMDTSGQFSPDGRWVAYRSTEAGRTEIYVTPFPAGGAKWQVSSNGGTQPRWSPDGKGIYFVSGDGDLSVTPVEVVGGRVELKESRALFPANFYVGPRIGLFGYAVRPDAKGFLVNSAGEVGAPRVALVENWDARLGQ